jgi:ankyrin repeat protein
LLQCLVAAVRPLRVKELAEVLTFDFNMEGIPKLNPGWRWEDQEEAVMSACSSLVMIVKDDDSRVVQFSHFSVKEFLIADRLAEPMRDVSRYHIQFDAAHTILVKACLGLLLQLDDRIDRGSIKNFPLARYAAQYWARHARLEDVSSRIKDGMESLFDADRPHFATWLWIYNDDWGLPMSTMRPESPEAFPLYHAARLGFRNLAEHLITKHPEHVNARGGGRGTPVLVAAFEGHSDILSLLIDHGADIDHQTDLKYTALIFATLMGHVELARMLLECGAIIDVRGHHGRTALHWAAQRGRLGAVRLLLEHGADVNVRDEDGVTPSELGSHYGHQEIVELLSVYGAESVKE